MSLSQAFNCRQSCYLFNHVYHQPLKIVL
jgi:hypothetical protein